MFKCNCGKLVNKVRYKNGIKSCDNCQPTNLSGQWERRIMQERAKYTKDILQPKNKDGSSNEDYIKAYGNSKTKGSY